MSMVLTASEGLVWLCGLLQPEAMSVVCSVTGNHVLARDFVLLLTVKKATLAVTLMIADAQLRKGHGRFL